MQPCSLGCGRAGSLPARREALHPRRTRGSRESGGLRPRWQSPQPCLPVLRQSLRLSIYRVRTHTRGERNAAVRVSERDTNRNPLGGVCLCAHFGCVCGVRSRRSSKSPETVSDFGPGVYVQNSVSRVCRVDVEFCLGWARNTVFEFLTSARPQTNPAVSEVQKLSSRSVTSWPQHQPRISSPWPQRSTSSCPAM